MKTKTINLYSFSELSEEAKRKALESWGNDNMKYFWGDDAIKSLLKFVEHFNGSLTNYQIDFLEPACNSYKLSIPENMPEKDIFDLLNELGSYNKKTLRGEGECKLTGYCMDEELIDGFRKSWFSGERDLRELINAGISQWEITVRKDYEFEFTMEFFADHADVNGLEFDEEGNLI